MGSILGLGRSPGEGNDKPLQYSCLDNPMDRGAWSATVHGVTESQTLLCFTLLCFCSTWLPLLLPLSCPLRRRSWRGWGGGVLLLEAGSSQLAPTERKVASSGPQSKPASLQYPPRGSPAGYGNDEAAPS